MVDQSKAKMFLASNRECIETDWCRRYATFDNGQQPLYSEAFDALRQWNDETLAGGKSLQQKLEEDAFIFLLPLVGVLQYTDNKGSDYLLQPGESLCVFLPKETVVTLSNPYDDELINFLQGLVCCNHYSGPFEAVNEFTLSNNSLSSVIASNNIVQCTAGKFDGRRDGVFFPQSIDSKIFVFVVQGAFEVQNRLLEGRDAMALWNVTAVEFEALSNEAILLFLEMATS